MLDRAVVVHAAIVINPDLVLVVHLGDWMDAVRGRGAMVFVDLQIVLVIRQEKEIFFI